MAENLVFLNLARYLHSGFFVVSWKKALRAGFRLDMVRTLNRNLHFCFSFSLCFKNGCKKPVLFLWLMWYYCDKIYLKLS